MMINPSFMSERWKAVWQKLHALALREVFDELLRAYSSAGG
jgi:hypothetical protein